MNCIWEDVPGSVDARGWRVIRCIRCGTTRGPTPSPHNVIRRRCKKFPFVHEVGEWVEHILAANFITPRGWAPVISYLGLVEVPESCKSCEARKRWLNTLGGRLSKSQSWVGKLLYQLLIRKTRSSSSPTQDRP